MHERSRSRFFSNTLALVLQTVVATLLTLVQVKVLSNFLPKDEFGLFVSLRGLSLLISMLAANGIPQVLVRFLPVSEARGDVRSALRTGTVALLLGTTLVVLLCLLAHVCRRQLFGFADMAIEETTYFWFYVTTVGVAVKLILYGAFNGLRRLSTQTVLEVTSLAAALAWIVAMRNDLSVGLLFRILGVVQVATLALGVPVYYALVRRSHGEGEEGGERPTRHTYVEYWLWATGLSLVALAFTDVDRYLLAHVLTLESLALFHIVSRISRLANRLLGVANLSLQPEISRLDAEARRQSIAASTAIFLKFNTVLAVVAAVAIAGFAGELISLVASPDYLPASALLVVLALSLPITTMTAPLTTAMKATDRVRDALWTDLAWAGAYVLLIFFLGARYGLIGVGAAQVAAAGTQLLLAARLSRLSVAGVLAEVGVKLALSAALVFWPVFASPLLGWGGTATVVLKALLFVIGCAAFVIVTRRVTIFTGPERRTMDDVLRARGLGALARLYS